MATAILQPVAISGAVMHNRGLVEPRSIFLLLSRSCTGSRKMWLFTFRKSLPSLYESVKRVDGIKKELLRDISFDSPDPVFVFLVFKEKTGKPSVKTEEGI